MGLLIILLQELGSALENYYREYLRVFNLEPTIQGMQPGLELSKSKINRSLADFAVVLCIVEELRVALNQHYWSWGYSHRCPQGVPSSSSPTNTRLSSTLTRA